MSEGREKSGPPLQHTRDVTIDALMERVLASQAKRPTLEGVSLIGGEPFEQDAPMAAFAERLRAAGLDVLRERPTRGAGGMPRA